MGVLYPTVTMGVSTLGIKMVDRLTASLDSEEPLLAVLRCKDASEVGAQLGDALQSLLEAGRNSAHLSEPRLDIFAFTDGWSQSSEQLIMVCKQASEVIGNRFGVLFPANRPPQQRTAGLHLLASGGRAAPPSFPASLATSCSPHAVTWVPATSNFRGFKWMPLSSRELCRPT